MRKENNLNNLLDNEEEVSLTLSYSKVSHFDRKGSACLDKAYSVQNNGLKAGSLVDDLLFSPDTFENKYYISEANEPSSTLGLLCKIIIDNYTELPTQDQVINIIKLNKFWSNIKNESLILAKLTDDFWNYLKDVYNSKGKLVVTAEEKSLSEEVVSILKTHDYSKSVFDENLSHIYQYSFESKIDKFIFKGIIDIISIDHNNKIVYFKDLKTGGNPSSDFLKSFIQYRYYLQEAVYTLSHEQIFKDLDLEGYTLAPFEFLYISLKEKIPVSFVVTDKWHTAALEGFQYNETYHRGLYRLLDEIYFHWKNKVYDLTKEQYENNGRINLNDNLITLI